MFLALLAEIAERKTIPQFPTEAELIKKWWAQKQALKNYDPKNLPTP